MFQSFLSALALQQRNGRGAAAADERGECGSRALDLAFAGSALQLRVRDTGAGVDPRSIEATLDGRPVRATLRNGIVSIATAGVSAGAHVLRVELADYQETRNMENVARILPNTRVVTTRITVRG